LNYNKLKNKQKIKVKKTAIKEAENKVFNSILLTKKQPEMRLFCVKKLLKK
jgi:hypothetical protein